MTVESVPLPPNTTLMIDGESVLVQGHLQCLVESKSVADTFYSVEWDDDAHMWTCTCRGFEIRRRCRHARAIDRWCAGTADVRFREDPVE